MKSNHQDVRLFMHLFNLRDINKIFRASIVDFGYQGFIQPSCLPLLPTLLANHKLLQQYNILMFQFKKQG